MHSSVLLDHFENPRNAGELPVPALMVEVSNPVCGDILRLSALIEEGTVTQAAFKARGCTACIAAGSVLTEILTGKDTGLLKGIRKEDVDEALGGLINESKHAAVLAIDAVRELEKKIDAAQ